jgi:hypothetical protein
MDVKASGNKSVDKLYGIEFQGNIIPAEWYSSILTASGKPYSIAISILAEIVYWYRPVVKRDEEKLNRIYLKKKFNADLLQINYAQLHEKFGYSKDQSRRAMDVLENKGLIRRELRSVQTERGCLGNVMFVDLNVDRLIEITYPNKNPYTKFHTRVSEKSNEIAGKNQQAIAKKPKTYTKNTTEINNKDYLSIFHRELMNVKKQVCYDALVCDRPEDRGMIDEIVNLIREIFCSEQRKISVNGEKMAVEIVKERFRGINMSVLQYVLDSIKKSTEEVKNKRAWLITILFNAPVTIETHYDTQVRHDLR